MASDTASNTTMSNNKAGDPVVSCKKKELMFDFKIDDKALEFNFEPDDSSVEFIFEADDSDIEKIETIDESNDK